MKRVKTWLRHNELFTRLFLLMTLFILIASTAIAAFTYTRARQRFLDSYLQSAELLMDKVQDDYRLLNENISRMMTMLDDSNVVETFMKDGPQNTANTIALQSKMQETRLALEDIPTNMILLGKNGATFFQNSGVRKTGLDDILGADFIKDINNTPALSQYYYLDAGLTTSTANQPGWLFVRKISDRTQVLGYALFFITEEHLRSIYSNLFPEEIHDIVIVDQNNRIISATDQNRLQTSYKEQSNLVLQSALYDYQFTVFNEINQSQLSASLNLIQPTLVIAGATILLISIAAFFLIRKTTRPIYHLIEGLHTVQDGDFSNKVTPEGSSEIQALGNAYNHMLDELQLYFNRLMVTEQEKRLTEIRSLQMQIRPHFIYNTLASIKFLIWQGENDKAVEAIDNFILLLRHTLRGANAVVTLAEEIEGANAYAEILSLRYGENVQISFFVPDEILSYSLPKMMIQPILENAYLHAFPDQQEGFIQVFGRIDEKKQQLQIEIMDNGVGFDQATTKANQAIQKQTAYSGIALQNINERIQLLYGVHYGLDIHSVPGSGTQITLRLPLLEKGADDHDRHS